LCDTIRACYRCRPGLGDGRNLAYCTWETKRPANVPVPRLAWLSVAPNPFTTRRRFGVQLITVVDRPGFGASIPSLGPGR